MMLLNVYNKEKNKSSLSNFNLKNLLLRPLNRKITNKSEKV